MGLERTMYHCRDCGKPYDCLTTDQFGYEVQFCYDCDKKSEIADALADRDAQWERAIRVAFRTTPAMRHEDMAVAAIRERLAKEQDRD